MNKLRDILLSAIRLAGPYTLADLQAEIANRIQFAGLELDGQTADDVPGELERMREVGLVRLGPDGWESVPQLEPVKPAERMLFA